METIDLNPVRLYQIQCSIKLQLQIQTQDLPTITLLHIGSCNVSKTNDLMPLVPADEYISTYRRQVCVQSHDSVGW